MYYFIYIYIYIYLQSGYLTVLCLHLQASNPLCSGESARRVKKFYFRHTDLVGQYRKEEEMSVKCLLILSVKMFYIFADFSWLN